MTEVFLNGSYIMADKIEIGKDFQIGKNVKIDVRGMFKIGDYSRFGDDVRINAQQVLIGNHFFHYEPGLNIGGGGSQSLEAELVVGDRCVFHNNKINLARPVIMGDDVGLSPDVDIITHGFWNSILEGYPCEYGKVVINNGVIIGQRSFILMNTSIAENVVIGANSTVKGFLDKDKSIYAGNPAKFIREIEELSLKEKKKILVNIIKDFNEKFIETGYQFLPNISVDYPKIIILDFIINVETKEYEGIEDEITDNFRDHLRRYGIRIYTERPFGNLTV